METRTLSFIRDGMHVRRYHMKHVIYGQSVGEHSCGVALLCWWLSAGQPSGTLIMAALTHDMAEGKFGDMPSPTKRELPDYPQFTFSETYDFMEKEELSSHGFKTYMSPEDRRTLKFADAAEGAIYCAEERMRGNKTLDYTWHKYMDYLGELEPTPGLEQDLMDHIRGEWKLANG